MTEIAGETQRKNGEKSDKDYSIEWFENTCIIEYKGEIKDRRILTFVPFINTLGEIGVSVTAWLSVITGYFGGIIFSASLSDIWSIILVLTGHICLVCYGLILFSYVKYVGITGCKNCHKAYAYEETKKPDIKEVSTEKEYKITITRYWKCKYCGYIDSTESPENIGTNKGKKKKPRKITCEKCGESGLYFEYKNPDIKFDDAASTRIRYYKCEYCGNVNIQVEKTSSAEGSSWENRGSDPRILN